MTNHDRYFVGLDLGQPGEPTALAVLGRPRLRPDDPPEKWRPAYALRHLRRFPPGTPYAEVIAEVRELLRTPPLPGSVLVVDQTGVGKAVVTMLVDGLRGRVTCSLWPVTITAGLGAAAGEHGGLLVPKKDLVGTLQVLLQTRRLRVARTLQDAALLVKELENYRMRVTLPKGDAPESWRESPHDDLVFAAAQAAWAGERTLPRADAQEPPVRSLRYMP